MGQSPVFLMAHPHSPAHLNVHNSTLSDEQTESFTFPIQDAHTATTPLLPVPLFRSVAHEMPREPYRLKCGGSHRREHDGHHAHIDDVPGHHRHVSARHTRHLMLHYAPRRYWLQERMTSCHPVCTYCYVKVLACSRHKNVAFCTRNVKNTLMV